MTIEMPQSIWTVLLLTAILSAPVVLTGVRRLQRFWLVVLLTGLQGSEPPSRGGPSLESL
jgi:hypothetical protein